METFHGEHDKRFNERGDGGYFPLKMKSEYQFQKSFEQIDPPD